MRRLEIKLVKTGEMQVFIYHFVCDPIFAYSYYTKTRQPLEVSSLPYLKPKLNEYPLHTYTRLLQNRICSNRREWSAMVAAVTAGAISRHQSAPNFCPIPLHEKTMWASGTLAWEEPSCMDLLT